MKKRVILLLCLLMCLFGVKAMAATLSAADTSRIMMNLPEGMVIDEARSYTRDGEMRIVIDTYATDWDMVATVARKSGSLVLNPQIKKPDNASRAKSFADYSWYNTSPENVESDVWFRLRNFSNGKAGDYVCFEQGLAIGRYDEGTGVFVPNPPPKGAGDGFAVCWRMNDDKLRYERVRIRFEFTHQVPVYTNRRLAKNVTANASGNPHVTSKSIDVDNGLVKYHAVKPKNGAVGTIRTKVIAPSWMGEMGEGSGWTATLRDRGVPASLQIHAEQKNKSADQYYVNVDFTPDENHASDRLYKKDWSIVWENKQKNKVVAFSLEAHFYVGNPKLTISYDESAEPLPVKSLMLIEKNKISGLKPSYDPGTGCLHLAVDKDQLPANRKTDLDEATVSVLITPPSTAVKYKLYGIQGDVIYGNSGEWLWSNEPVNIKPGEKIALEDLTDLVYFREHSVTLANGKEMNYYFSPGMWGGLGGYTLMLEWIDSHGNVIGKKQHITVTTDSYKVQQDRKESLIESPEGKVTEPSILAQNTDLHIVYAQLPQMGDDVMRYEFALENGNGEAVKLGADESVLLYLPYPDGKRADQFVQESFVVYHQLADGDYEEFSVEKGNLTFTEYGLCMEVTSFSPYYLSWESAPDTSALPQTGDRSNLALWLLLAVGAMAGCMTLKKKKAA